MQVLTVVEGTVPEERLAAFERIYYSSEKADIPEGLILSFLIKGESGVCRIEALWADKALEKIQNSGVVAEEIKLFLSQGVVPELKFFRFTD